MNRTSLALLLSFTCSTPLLAQRPTPTFEWQKRSAVVEYGAVPLGKHTLAELPVGQSWRLGMNAASSLLLQMPALAGDAVIAPGHYRIQLQRSGETTGSLVAHAAGMALGSSGDVAVPGTLGKASKPTKKLTIDWAKNGAAAQGNQPVKLVVQYGEQEWQGGLELLGSKLSTVSGWKLAMFHWPAARLGTLEQSALPLAVLSRGNGEEHWNLLVGKGEAKLVPWLQMPEDQNGFAAVVPIDPKAILSGSLAVEDQAEGKPLAVAELLSAQLQKGEFALKVAYDQKILRITLPEPKASKPAK